MFSRTPDNLLPDFRDDHWSLKDAKASQLDALASYFEREARRLRLAAKSIRHVEADQRQSLSMRPTLDRSWLAAGARVEVLRRRGMTAADRFKTMQELTGWNATVLRAAHQAWLRSKRMLGKGAR